MMRGECVEVWWVVVRAVFMELGMGMLDVHRFVRLWVC